MNTIADLTATLTNALGLPRRLVDETAEHLREAGMLPGDAAVATTPEHAVVLLLGLMAAPEPKDAPNVARLYFQLPLDCVTRAEATPDGSTELFDISDPSPVMADVRDIGETFGAYLTSQVEFSKTDPDFFVQPGEIIVGGGPGTATGAVGIQIQDGNHFVCGFVKFSLAPLGGGRHPDDAPLARLDCHATVPDTIFEVLYRFFADAPDGTQKIARSHIENAPHLSGGHS